MVPTLSARCHTLVEMAEAARFYFQDPRPYEEKGAKKFLTRRRPHSRRRLRRAWKLCRSSPKRP